MDQQSGNLDNTRIKFHIPEMDQNEWYNQVYDLSPSLCMVMNPEGFIIDCNLALAKALGYSIKGYVQGHSVMECAEESSKQTLESSFEVWKKTGKIHNHEFKMKRADGSTFPALLNATSIHDELGRIIACNAVILNITELVNARKKLELVMNDLIVKDRELHEMNEELKRVERPKEEFLSMVSHELKNPLTPIIAFSDMLKAQAASGNPFTERQLNTIPTINQNAKEMKRLIDDLLSVYKLEMRLKFTFSESNMKELVDQVIAELSSMLSEKGIILDMNILLKELKKDTALTCDALRIKQVLINLIRNSIDFLPSSGGKITITLEEGEEQEVEQQHNTPTPVDTTKSGAMLVSVVDNGPGVPPDKVAGLFKKFYQADPGATRRHGGTGLGLTICKEIVEMHGGRIWYDSLYKNGGACFKFLLPRIPPPPPKDNKNEDRTS